jgi:hypothetical protein
VARIELIEERVELATKQVKQLSDFELEMERLTMSREDKLSREVEEHNHRELFKQKDLFPPVMPSYFTDDSLKKYLKNKPVQPIPTPGAP